MYLWAKHTLVGSLEKRLACSCSGGGGGVLKPKVSAGHRSERHGDGMGDQLTAGPAGERGPGGETLKGPIRAKTIERREGGAGRPPGQGPESHDVGDGTQEP